MSVLHLSRENHIEVDSSDIFKNDILGFQEPVSRLAKLITNVETPFTLGICGRWGSGKTSFMMLLQALLCNEYSRKTFWFNAWEYENETSLLLPLLSNLSNDFPLETELWKNTKKYASVAAYIGASAILKSVTSKIIEINDVEKAFKLVEENSAIYEKWVSESQKLKVAFQNIVNSIDENGIIIFVDDLDRCLPETVVKLIENIKHFLSVKKCIFILGIDDFVLKRIISSKYNNVIDGSEYLEKIINYSFHIPTNQTIDIKKFVINYIDSVTENGFSANHTENIDYLIDTLVATDFVNPRRIKHILARYTIYLSLDNCDKYINELVVKLLLYRCFLEDVYFFKRKKNDVTFSPAQLGRSIGYKEVESETCKGFAELIFNPRYAAISTFSNKAYTCASFFDRTITREYLEGEQFNSTETRTFAIEHFQNNGFFSNKEYFGLIDFLFSFS